jgi:hypothetical protein
MTSSDKHPEWGEHGPTWDDYRKLEEENARYRAMASGARRALQAIYSPHETMSLEQARKRARRELTKKAEGGET